MYKQYKSEFPSRISIFGHKLVTKQTFIGFALPDKTHQPSRRVPNNTRESQTNTFY